MSEPKYTVQQFDKALHDRGAFSCGIDAMDNWFKGSISQQINDNRVHVWCAIDSAGAVVGFYALCMHSVAPEDATALASKKERQSIPAVYLVAIATHNSIQGQGLGKALMADALQRSYSISTQIGAAAVILDVLDDGALEKRVKFYRNLGFTSIDPKKDKRLFISMKDIAANILAPA